MLWIAAGTFCILDCLPVALPLPLYVGFRHTTLLIHCTLLHSTLAIPWGALLDLFAVGLPPPPFHFISSTSLALGPTSGCWIAGDLELPRQQSGLIN